MHIAHIETEKLFSETKDIRIFIDSGFLNEAEGVTVVLRISNTSDTVVIQSVVILYICKKVFQLDCTNIISQVEHS